MNRPTNGREEEEAARIARQERAVEVVAAIKVARAFALELEELARECTTPAEQEERAARLERITVVARELHAQHRGALERAGELAQERPARARYSITQAGREAIGTGDARDTQAAAFLESIAVALDTDAVATRHGLAQGETRLGAALRNEAARLRAGADPLGPLGSGL